MMQPVYLTIGIVSVALGVIGIVVPLLPTVPFMILAAFCFAKANPVWEKRLLDHPRFGPHIVAWRERGAISKRGKIMALVALAASAVIGLVALDSWHAYMPLAVALISGTWIATRPS
ncbi:YbaN family protein [Sphingoaurantiacus capsulatus]|uniref:YbaN family protein n=1 Tax=Sphingoaurantiacus capsulatus TaxID=1771310 RepID=A0ABV7XA49_9SPHN